MVDAVVLKAIIRDLFQFVPTRNNLIELRLNGELQGVFDSKRAVMEYLRENHSPDEGRPFRLSIVYQPVEEGRVRAMINGKVLREFPNKGAARRFIHRHHLQPLSKSTIPVEPGALMRS